MSDDFEPEDEELARIWLADDTLHYSVEVGFFEEPATWGDVLADMANYAAETLAAGDEAMRKRLLDEMKVAFLETLDARSKDGGA